MKLLTFMSKLFTNFKGTLLALRQILATEGPLKMTKNAFCFTLKALFVLRIFKFFPRLFSSSRKTV